MLFYIIINLLNYLKIYNYITFLNNYYNNNNLIFLFNKILFVFELNII